MEIVGKIILAFPESSGISKAGNPWKKREYVLETQDTSYPQKIFFDFFGDKADQYPLEVGQVIKLSFDIQSREYNDRWYTSISGWRAEQITGTNSNSQQNVASEPSATSNNEYGTPVIPPADVALNAPEDDLPF